MGTRRTRARTLGAIAISLFVWASACGAWGRSLAHPSGARALVVRIATGGGLVPQGYELTDVPEFSAFGDGTIVTPGPQIAIYPPPALPTLVARKATERGLQTILRAASDAGLLGADAHLRDGNVADGSTTTFTVVAGGRRHTISVYALDVDTAAPPSEAAARAALSRFRSRALDPESFIPAGELGPARAYDATAMRVIVRAYDPSSALRELPQAEVTWPLATDLSAFGTALPWGRCGVVSGEDLAAVLALARGANTLTPWRSGSARYALAFRPLLPDESGC